MKIIQATFRYYPSSGGVEDYVQRISEGLALKGHKVEIFTSDIEEDSHYSRVKDAPKIHNGVKIRRFKSSLKFKNYIAFPFMPVSMMLEEADLIHGHCYMYFPLDCAALICRMKKIPMVFNPYLADIGPPSAFGKLYRHTLGKLAFSSDVVIVISDYEKELIYKWGYKPRCVQKITPGVDIEEFDAVKHDIYDKYGFKDKIKILYAGRLSKSKGIDVLVKAFGILAKKIPNAELVIVGPDFGEKDNLNKLATGLNISPRVHFLDKLSRNDLVSAFKGADIFVLPSRYEAFGIVLIEAMAAKVPVVAARNSAIPYVVKDGVTGVLFQTDNYEDLAGKLMNLLKNDAEKERLVKNGFREVINNYSWENAIDKIEEIYLNLERSKQV